MNDNRATLYAVFVTDINCPLYNGWVALGGMYSGKLQDAQFFKYEKQAKKCADNERNLYKRTSVKIHKFDLFEIV